MKVHCEYKKNVGSGKLKLSVNCAYDRSMHEINLKSLLESTASTIQKAHVSTPSSKVCVWFDAFLVSNFSNLLDDLDYVFAINVNVVQKSGVHGFELQLNAVIDLITKISGEVESILEPLDVSCEDEERTKEMTLISRNLSNGISLALIP